MLPSSLTDTLCTQNAGVYLSSADGQMKSHEALKLSIHLVQETLHLHTNPPAVQNFYCRGLLAVLQQYLCIITTKNTFFKLKQTEVYKGPYDYSQCLNKYNRIRDVYVKTVPMF